MTLQPIGVRLSPRQKFLRLRFSFELAHTRLIFSFCIKSIGASLGFLALKSKFLQNFDLGARKPRDAPIDLKRYVTLPNNVTDNPFSYCEMVKKRRRGKFALHNI